MNKPNLTAIVGGQAHQDEESKVLEENNRADQEESLQEKREREARALLGSWLKEVAERLDKEYDTDSLDDAMVQKMLDRACKTMVEHPKMKLPRVARFTADYFKLKKRPYVPTQVQDNDQ